MKTNSIKCYAQAALGFSLLLTEFAEAEPAAKKSESIGVYDSRAVAVAYAGSSFQREKLAQLKQEWDDARAKGDTNRLAALENKGKAWQHKANEQAFQTAPVIDLLACVSNKIPAIKAKYEVTQLISKWDAKSLEAFPGAKKIDVTAALIDAFDPAERSRQWAREIQSRKPEKTLHD